MANSPKVTTIRQALDLAIRAPSIHNSQPWRWRWRDPVLNLNRDDSRWLPETDPERTDLVVSCGAVLHHARVALASLGCAVTVDRSPDPAEPEHLAAVTFTSADPEPDLAARATAITARCSNRAAYTSWEVPSGIIDALIRVGTEQAVMVAPVRDPHAYRALVDAVSAAESARASDAQYQAETAAWTGLTASAEVGVLGSSVATETYDLNRIPFLNGRRHASPAGSSEDDASALLVVGTRHDDATSRLRAGEAMSAVLLEATAIGLATCPLSLPVEVPETRQNLRESLFAGSAHPQVIVRVGWAHVGHQQAPRTSRLPLDAVFDVE